MQNIKAGEYMEQSAKGAVDAAMAKVKADVLTPSKSKIDPAGAAAAPAEPSPPRPL